MKYWGLKLAIFVSILTLGTFNHAYADITASAYISCTSAPCSIVVSSGGYGYYSEFTPQYFYLDSTNGNYYSADLNYLLTTSNSYGINPSNYWVLLQKYSSYGYGVGQNSLFSFFSLATSSTDFSSELPATSTCSEGSAYGLSCRGQLTMKAVAFPTLGTITSPTDNQVFSFPSSIPFSLSINWTAGSYIVNHGIYDKTTHQTIWYGQKYGQVQTSTFQGNSISNFTVATSTFPNSSDSYFYYVDLFPIDSTGNISTSTMLETTRNFSISASSTLPTGQYLNLDGTFSSSTQLIISTTDVTDLNIVNLKTKICPFGDFGCIFQQAFAILLAPDPSTLQRYVDLKGSIENKPPFGYFSKVTSDLNNLSATSSTSTFSLAIPTVFMTNFFTPVRTGLAGIVILFGAIVLFKRIENIQL